MLVQKNISFGQRSEHVFSISRTSRTPQLAAVTERDRSYLADNAEFATVPSVVLVTQNPHRASEWHCWCATEVCL